MFATIARAVFGSANDRSLKGYQQRVPAINAHEPATAALTDEALQAKTAEFRARLAGGATLDGLLPEAFAVVREASRRVLGLRHFDVQMIGGMVLHDGKIAEMKTGEGKTLVATLPVYLNALPGKGVHVVTVNDYLARRDSEWMGRVYGFLGMTTGVIVHGLNDDERRAAYAADITYGTNNEFGFDYLRDNMKYRLEDMVPARLRLRHRRRGGQHPDRRGPHPADHLRPRRGQQRPLPHRQPGRPRAGQGRHHLREGREVQKTVHMTETGIRAGRGDAARRRHHHRGQRSTTSSTSPWSTTSSNACAPTPCSPATSTTSSATTRSC